MAALHPRAFVYHFRVIHKFSPAGFCLQFTLFLFPFFPLFNLPTSNDAIANLPSLSNFAIHAFNPLAKKARVLLIRLI